MFHAKYRWWHRPVVIHGFYSLKNKRSSTFQDVYHNFFLNSQFSPRIMIFNNENFHCYFFFCFLFIIIICAHSNLYLSRCSATHSKWAGALLCLRFPKVGEIFEVEGGGEGLLVWMNLLLIIIYLTKSFSFFFFKKKLS